MKVTINVETGKGNKSTTKDVDMENSVDCFRTNSPDREFGLNVT